MMKIIDAPELISWQKDFYDIFKKYQNEPVIFVIKSPRLVGKSFVMSLLLMRQSINYKNAVSWFISPTLHQARKVFKDIIKMIGDIPCISKIDSQLLEIYFYNGSEIHFGSAEQRENLRGNTVSGKGILVIDEAAYVKDDIIATVMPYVNVNKRPIIMVSTPLFKDGRFYDLFTSNEKTIIPFDICDYDLSFFITDILKQMYKQSMPPQKYISEIMGLFMEESSGIFGKFKHIISNTVNINNKLFYYGIDWGSGSDNDYTAICIMNSLKQMVRLDYFNDKDVQLTIEHIKKLTNQYPPLYIIVEKNSIGKVFFDLLRKSVNYNVKSFDTTNQTKNDIINNLLVHIQNGTVQLLDDNELKLELINYLIEKTNTGKITYNAKSGYHDDCIMATAICLKNLSNNYSIR